MKKTLAILSFLILFTSFLGCQNMQYKEKCNLHLSFKTLILDSCKSHLSDLRMNRKQPLEVVFYKIEKKMYVRIVETVGISFDKIKGYCEFDNYIIAYYGVNDSLSQKYLNLINSNIKRLKKEYCNLDEGWTVDLKEDRIKDYWIEDDSLFRRFKLTDSLLIKYEELLIEGGIRSLPPPPPFDDFNN